MRTVRLVPSAAAALLLLTACTGGDDPAPSTTAPSATPEAGALEECLQGEWSMAAEAGQQLENLPGVEGSVDVQLDGEVVVAFADGTVTATYDNQRITATTDIEGQELVIEMSLSGSAEGVYRVDASEVAIEDVDPSTLDVATTTTLGGEQLDVPVPGLDDLARASTEAIEGTTTAECTEDRLTLTADGEDRAPMVLERRS